MDWYYADGDQQVGPVSQDDFDRLVQGGTVTGETLVWQEGMANWLPYAQLGGGAVAEAVAVPALTGPATCTECGREFAGDDLIAYGNSRVCAACKPLFFQKLREGALPAGALAYAGFWIRVGAKLVDSLILQVVSMIAGFAVGLMLAAMEEPNLAVMFIPSAVAFIFHAVYDTYFIGKFGATPGKMACRLKIVMPDGGPISYPRALGRHFAEMLSGMILGIGYLMVAFDKEEHRSLHDRICNTRVIKKTI